MQDYWWVSVIWSSLIRVLVNDDHCNLNVGSWNSDPSYTRSFSYGVMLYSRRPGLQFCMWGSFLDILIVSFFHADVVSVNVGFCFIFYFLFNHSNFIFGSKLR